MRQRSAAHHAFSTAKEFALGSSFSKKSPSTNSIRRDGHEWGKKEAELAIISLGGGLNRLAAIEWINSSIIKRTKFLRASGLSSSEIRTWRLACRTMFLLNINYALKSQ